MTAYKIPNIDIGQVYDAHSTDSEIHYESFSKLAHFFGRNMPVHAHDRYFQIHYLYRGHIHLQLDGHLYIASAPLFVITPPSVPHAFVTNDDTEGHVLTIEQNWAWEFLQQLYPRQTPSLIAQPLCITLDDAVAAAQLNHLWQRIAHESQHLSLGYTQAIVALTQLLWLDLQRLNKNYPIKLPSMRANVRLFQQFNQLIEVHFMKHQTLAFYAKQLHLTEMRLNHLCQKTAGSSPKLLINNRLLRECRHLLVHSPLSIQEIAYQLGFKDPSYFSRFFSKAMEQSPSAFREQKSNEKYQLMTEN